MAFPIRPRELLCLALWGSLVVPGSAGAYQLRENKDGKVLVWKQPRVKVWIDTSAAPERARDPDAVLAGFVAWISSGVPTQIDVKMSDEPLETGNDNKNVVLWQTEEWGFGREVVATTVSTFDRDSGFVVDSDILFNGVDHDWTNLPLDGGREYDVQNVMTHEAGHFFGLGHETADSEATMYPTTPPCETKKRTLGDDDVAAIAALVAEIETRTGSGGSLGQGDEQSASRDADDGPPAAEAMGCAMPGASASSHPPLLAVLLLLGLLCARSLQRRRGLRVVLALLAATVAVSRPAAATVMEGLTLDQLTDRAQVIVRGQVVESHPVYVGRLVFTEHAIAAASCLKGACTTVTTVRTAGGDLGGGLAMHVDGVASLTRDQQVVLFLQRRGGNNLRTVGLSQGAFFVQQGQVQRDLRHVGLVVDVGGHRRVVSGGVVRLPLEQLERRVRARAQAIDPSQMGRFVPQASSAPLTGRNMALQPGGDLSGTRFGTSPSREVRGERVPLERAVTPLRQLDGLAPDHVGPDGVSSSLRDQDLQ